MIKRIVNIASFEHPERLALAMTGGGVSSTTKFLKLKWGNISGKIRGGMEPAPVFTAVKVVSVVALSALVNV